MRNRLPLRGNIRSSNRYELVEVIKTNNENKSQTDLQPRIQVHTTSAVHDHEKSGGRDVRCCRASWHDARQRNREDGAGRRNGESRTVIPGSLVVYSATDEFEDGEVPYYAHSSYAIYTTAGKLFKNVENHISRSDEIPEIVILPVGSYVIEARSERRLCPRARRYQGWPANNPRPGFAGLKLWRVSAAIDFGNKIAQNR
jgi:hypothetical protein